MSGLLRVFWSSGLFACPVLGPWQLVQVGVRASALVPCLVWPMARTGKVLSWSWQRVHCASPRKAMSLGLSSWPKHAVPTPASATIAPAIQTITLFRNFELLRPGAIGLGVGNAEVAVDAGHAAGFQRLVFLARGLRLLLRIHLRGRMAMAALARVGLLHDG